MKNPMLVITPGDPEGIGPEVTSKALHALRARLLKFQILVVGSTKPFTRKHSLPRLPELIFVEPPGRASPGFQSGWAIETAAQLVMASPRSRALITGPVSKERLRSAGFPYQGHTDFLADLTRSRKVTMMLANDTFRVALVTNHCPLNEVAGRINRDSLTTTIENGIAFCETGLGRKRPRLAVLALNPHAGDGGVIGLEDSRVIAPTLKKLQSRFPHVDLTGPWPADSFFAIEKLRAGRHRHDLIIALYHDQGLIPVKLSGFSRSMNMTLGLPIIRTSVDHGTAFDIAGKGRADPGSMIFAIENAIHFLSKRGTS